MKTYVANFSDEVFTLKVKSLWSTKINIKYITKKCSTEFDIRDLLMQIITQIEAFENRFIAIEHFMQMS